MHELFELVHKDPEVWSPVPAIGAVMRLSGEPQVGDFMAVQNGASVFLCKEVSSVRIVKVDGVNIQFDMGRGIPTWFQQAQSAIQATPGGIFFRGKPMQEGDSLVFDGCFITLEKESATEAS